MARETKKQREARLERERDAALEREDRVLLAAEILLAGGDDRTIRREARQADWGLEDDEVAAIVADAREQMLEAAGGDAQTVLKEHVAKRRALYRRAMRANDHRTAAALLRDEAELLGLYAREKGAGGREPARKPPDWHTSAQDVQEPT